MNLLIQFLYIYNHVNYLVNLLIKVILKKLNKNNYKH